MTEGQRAVIQKTRGQMLDFHTPPTDASIANPILRVGWNIKLSIFYLEWYLPTDVDVVSLRRQVLYEVDMLEVKESAPEKKLIR